MKETVKLVSEPARTAPFVPGPDADKEMPVDKGPMLRRRTTVQHGASCSTTRNPADNIGAAVPPHVSCASQSSIHDVLSVALLMVRERNGDKEMGGWPVGVVSGDSRTVALTPAVSRLVTVARLTESAYCTCSTIDELSCPSTDKRRLVEENPVDPTTASDDELKASANGTCTCTAPHELTDREGAMRSVRLTVEPVAKRLRESRTS
mmetsp:Transcript_64289/g.172072  ORF Transcript_64289/g.172072 Transcript_64289/m.172072 type:complete len:207 (-) Transcript_64289:71-691(-)